ncbi:hypothetical protein LJC49_05300 [Ruminococcaceae bacterium OttesenSCG-928-I18]|nr:hypothetical protein [Ruminococcaceae bacterium OttesenSCG-928-I18]
MQPNEMKVAMIHQAVKKGISDIKEDPGRGIRNLVELGEMFAGGRFQKDFFTTVMTQLKDENSAYYKLVEQVANVVDAGILTTIGVNIGYNSLSHGATMIRETEKQEGYNVPWCLTVDTGRETFLPSETMERLVTEGKELGIYTYLVFIEEGYPHFEALFDVFGRQEECAFMPFIHPHKVDEALCKHILRAQNIVPFIDLDCKDPEVKKQAAQNLLTQGCLCGGFNRQKSLQEEQVGPRLLEETASLGLPIFLSIGDKCHLAKKVNGVYGRFVHLREHLTLPVLPIDLYSDIAHVDKVISSEACLASIKGNGSFHFTNVDRCEQTSGFNIHSISLREALMRVMGKKKADEVAPA